MNAEFHRNGRVHIFQVSLGARPDGRISPPIEVIVDDLESHHTGSRWATASAYCSMHGAGRARNRTIPRAPSWSTGSNEPNKGPTIAGELYCRRIAGAPRVFETLEACLQGEGGMSVEEAQTQTKAKGLDSYEPYTIIIASAGAEEGY